MATLDCTAGNLNLTLTAGRDKTFTVTATGFNTTGCTHLAEFRETPDLNSNVLFTLSTANNQITQVPGTNSTVSFQVLAANTADYAGQTLYWSWKITFADSTKDDWLEGFVSIVSTPTE